MAKQSVTHVGKKQSITNNSKLHSCMLDLDHIDGDHYNNIPDNIHNISQDVVGNIVLVLYGIKPMYYLMEHPYMGLTLAKKISKDNSPSFSPKKRRL